MLRSDWKNIAEHLIVFGLIFPVIIASGVFTPETFTFRFHTAPFVLYLATLSYFLIQITGSQNPFLRLQQHKEITLSLLGFILLCVVQFLIFWLPNPLWQGTADPIATYLAIPYTAAYLLLLLVLLDYFSDLFRIEHFLDALFLAIALLSLIYLFLNFYSGTPHRFNYFYFSGTWVSQDRFAFLLNLILPYGITSMLIRGIKWWERSAAIHRWQWNRLIGSDFLIRLLAVFLLSLSTGWSQSRSGTVAVGIAVLVTLSSLVLYEFKRENKQTALVLITIIAVILFSFVLFVNFFLVPNLLQKIGGWYFWIFDISFVRPEFGIGGRLEIYRNTLELVKLHPLFGVGLGGFINSFILIAPEYYEKGTIILFAHNDYLELLAETGLAGFLLLLGIPLFFTGKVLIRIFHSLRRVHQKDFYLLMGIGGGLIAAAVHSLTDFSLKISINAMVFCALTSAFLQTAALILNGIPAVPRWTLQKKISIGLAFLFCWIILLGVRESIYLPKKYFNPENWYFFSGQARFQVAAKIKSLEDLLSKNRNGTMEEKKLIDEILKSNPKFLVDENLGDVYLKHQLVREAQKYYLEAHKQKSNVSRILKKLLETTVSILNEENQLSENSQVVLRAGFIELKPFDPNDEYRRYLLSQIKNPYLRKKITRSLEES